MALPPSFARPAPPRLGLAVTSTIPVHSYALPPSTTPTAHPNVPASPLGATPPAQSSSTLTAPALAGDGAGPTAATATRTPLTQPSPDAFQDSRRPSWVASATAAGAAWPAGGAGKRGLEQNGSTSWTGMDSSGLGATAGPVGGWSSDGNGVAAPPSKRQASSASSVRPRTH